jgi:hypothetical protein
MKMARNKQWRKHSCSAKLICFLVVLGLITDYYPWKNSAHLFVGARPRAKFVQARRTSVVDEFLGHFVSPEDDQYNNDDDDDDDIVVLVDYAEYEVSSIVFPTHAAAVRNIPTSVFNRIILLINVSLQANHSRANRARDYRSTAIFICAYYCRTNCARAYHSTAIFICTYHT